MTVFHHVSLESIVLLVEIFVFVRQSKQKIYKNKNWIEWPSRLASSISLTGLKLSMAVYGQELDGWPSR